jgi:hypothetical protein
MNEDEEPKRKIFKSIKTKSYINKNSKSSKDDFESMTREELIAELTRLNNHNFQLKNLLEKANGANQNCDESNKKYKDRPFDFNKYHKRHVFLKFAYLGWNYQVTICKSSFKYIKF